MNIGGIASLFTLVLATGSCGLLDEPVKPLPSSPWDLTVDAALCGGAHCPAPLVCCDNWCEDFTNSPRHCGGCDKPGCTAANGTAECHAGVCQLVQCDPGFTDCNHRLDDGCENNTAADILHCGSCGRTCIAGANATPRCQAGECVCQCREGYQTCRVGPDTCCDTNTEVDPNNCGACGKRCGQLANGMPPVCKAGACYTHPCAGWFDDCDGNPSTGCESDTQVDPKNCGLCGVACKAPQKCVQGKCI